MIKAIIFDCFGVLTSDGWLPFKESHFGHDKELKQQVTNINKQVDAGLADYDDFIFSVAELAGVPPAQARAEIENNVADQQLFNYIESRLKPEYRIAMLSNAGANWLGELFSAQQVALFDAVSLSCETGFVKPDDRAYAHVAQTLGVASQECVFIDDQESYASGARDVGMQVIIYKNFEQCKSELEAILAA